MKMTRKLPGAMRISERGLAGLLIGPTSGANAERLAAWAFGRGPEYDTRVSRDAEWIPGDDVREVVMQDYGLATVREGS